MMAFKEINYIDMFPQNNLILVGDIGGTNSNFGVCSIENNSVKLLFSLHTNSKDITDFPSVVHDVLTRIRSQYKISLHHACFAAAGVVSEQRDVCKPTNLPFVIDAHTLRKKTGLETAVIINDFEAVGYGIDYIASDDLKVINKGQPRTHATRAIIGAGTGLGKGILSWDAAKKRYMPIPSEGGHADFPLYNSFEVDFVKFTQKLQAELPISWEHVLSGNGIVRLYTFLGQRTRYQKTQYAKQILESGTHPDHIFQYWHDDQQCADTYACYGTWYARCAKNFALETLSLGGLYIAGGIAAKNIPLFERAEFMQEFTKSIKQAELLQKIPITIIADYNVSLFGAAAYVALQK